MNDNDCGCVDMPTDGETCDFASRSTPKARKPHKCCECGGEIPIGALYERVTNKYEGTMDTLKTCLPCVEIRNLLCCDGYVYELLWESIRDYFREGGKIVGCLTKLESTAAKEKLSDAYRAFIGVRSDV